MKNAFIFWSRGDQKYSESKWKRGKTMLNWNYYNPNPMQNSVGDCVVRALTLALNLDWDKTYMELLTQGFEMKDMPSSNEVWMSLLTKKGYKRFIIPNECPNCYTIEAFCRDHPKGLYILATGTHVVACLDGDYYDSWDSGSKIPIYYFKKEA